MRVYVAAQLIYKSLIMIVWPWEKKVVIDDGIIIICRQKTRKKLLASSESETLLTKMLDPWYTGLYNFYNYSVQANHSPFDQLRVVLF